MAARSGAGTGVVVGLVVFVLSTIFLLVMTIVYYSRYTDARQEAIESRSLLSDYATEQQRNSDAYKAIAQQAQGGGQSAMGFLVDQRNQIMSKVLGNSAATVDDLNARLAAYGSNVNAGTTYVDVLQQLRNDLSSARAESQGYAQQISELRNQINQSEQLLAQARQDKDQEVQAVRDMIATFMQDVAQYGNEVAETKSTMLQMVDELESTFDSQVEQLERTIDNLRSQLAVKETQLGQYQQIIDEIRLKARNPALLVDATILDNANSQGQVFISRGRDDKITLGMTFEVYDSPEMLRPDENGNLPRGKASLQVINVNQTTSTAKITRTSPGRPVVRGDVLANAIYDPDKEYMFLVHGKFDVNGDGRPSESEADYVRNLIREWGGTLVEGDQIRGDLDFLVLGAQPNKPMDLPNNPSQELVNVWVRQNEAFQTYNMLMQDAMQANIPVLNQNRLLVLIGHTNN